MYIAKLISDKTITIFLENKPYMIPRDHKVADKLLEALENNDLVVVQSCIDVFLGLKTWVSANLISEIKIKDDQVLYNGEVIESKLTDRILEWVRLGQNPEPMLNFMARLMKNPSFSTRRDLLQFLEYGDIPILDDGRFVAYKVVTKDFKDKHTKTIDNSIGKIVTMERNKVDDDRQSTCSSGLHFCSYEYIKHFMCYGDKLILVAIDPEDVVSIPYDYNDTKGRCCKYEVLSEIQPDWELPSVYYNPDKPDQETEWLDEDEWDDDFCFDCDNEDED